MQDTLSSGESTELVRLWRRRQQLSPDEMGRMYAIVGDALRSCSPPELKVLGESRQELVAQFIYVKVLRLDADPDELEEGAAPVAASDHSAPSTAYALCAYFRRYLIDCTRASSFRRKLSIGEQVSEAQLDAQLGSHLARKLPSYMLPDRILRLDGMPRNDRGKNDRIALRRIAAGEAS